MSLTLQLDRARFLTEYWQQKPLLIKAGFADFARLPPRAFVVAGLFDFQSLFWWTGRVRRLTFDRRTPEKDAAR
jgi:hypothetical protein